MICKSFFECGGCILDMDYTSQLEYKIQTFQNLFEYQLKKEEIFTSPTKGYRARAEFRLHRENSKVYLSMNSYGKNNRIKISSCPILLPILQEKLSLLLDFINSVSIIEHKLYGVKILGSLNSEVIITLIYHKKLSQEWQDKANELSEKINCHIIGRSRGQKIIITQDFINETLQINHKKYFYIQKEGSFSQPNPFMNIQMIEFILSKLPEAPQSDLLELYCGSGNFTLPISKRFKKILSTEIVKSAISTLQLNIKNNHINNITPVRLSGLETIEALSYKRDFFRLKNIDLKVFDFSHIFLDPPRNGISDIEMLQFIQNFENIIYISCNPNSLKKDLEILLKTHSIKHQAIFDQFPYTHHLECGFILNKNKL
ncbi:tRNA (uridine(54)-C5)-methyltransferase TrmA [Helicobacter sp. 13S00477-4]|uniref:tRNA (uridine(54)-C5)-methyltransferase TrmA n=1 Tax=Helicobacter sp. 13S00477-4 TaxID=1905759 RepID=UPI000BA4ED7E|nr:tRNA (uridine(54)-C5)-methyltransferase TrmA [Helicobacter sp. 13S00477-4]PAF52478.1 tRNA (uridine(54)-C5)-methyltransferase TrmA [Helicobacter sp. 13S00477-4]